jgi:uncharacterized protein (TIGR03663 family)
VTDNVRRLAFWGLVTAAVALALVLRLAALDRRPMHHDEANQAVRFGQLLETGEYRYDRAEHHGPTLYYLTLPAAWLTGRTSLASLDEWVLRSVPVAFGAGLILLLLPLERGIGRAGVLATAALIAVAPPLAYYSGFYIQEPLLVFFLLGFLVAAGRYVLSGCQGAAAWAGACAGLAIATKETAWLLLPVALVACLLARWLGRRGRPDDEAFPPLAGGHLVAAGAIAAGVAALFYSSFFANLQGLIEPFGAVGVYAARGVAPEAHREPWYYYLRLLHLSFGGGMRWLDLGVVVFVVPCVALAVRGSSTGPRTFWARTVVIYAATATAVFSALPYKTPWNLLPFHVAWLAAAGIGAAEGLARARAVAARVGAVLAVLAVCLTLGVQAWRVNVRYPSDPRNPYAYAQTSPDILRLSERVRAVSALHPDRDRMLVAVVAGPYEQWPLPWYLRRMSRVGYWSRVELPVLRARTPLVIASAEHADAVATALGEGYQAEYYGLRPEVLLTVFIEQRLWDRFIETVR